MNVSGSHYRASAPGTPVALSFGQIPNTEPNMLTEEIGFYDASIESNTFKIVLNLAGEIRGYVLFMLTDSTS